MILNVTILRAITGPECVLLMCVETIVAESAEIHKQKFVFIALVDTNMYMINALHLVPNITH